MKYCQNCGAEVNENAVACIKCGCSIQPEHESNKNKVDDSVDIGLVILSAFIPLFGIIYWPVKAKERPNCARTCGITAIIAMIIWSIFF